MDNKIVEVEDLIVHRFLMSDVDDPILYAAEPLYKWEKSEAGQWVMQHAVETPVWHQRPDVVTMGHVFVIKARLKAKDATYFRLKWGTVA